MVSSCPISKTSSVTVDEGVIVLVVEAVGLGVIDGRGEVSVAGGVLVSVKLRVVAVEFNGLAELLSRAGTEGPGVCPTGDVLQPSANSKKIIGIRNQSFLEGIPIKSF